MASANIIPSAFPHCSVNGNTNLTHLFGIAHDRHILHAACISIPHPAEERDMCVLEPSLAIKERKCCVANTKKICECICLVWQVRLL